MNYNSQNKRIPRNGEYVNPGSGVKLDALNQSNWKLKIKQLATAKRKIFWQVEGLLKDDPTANFIQTRVGQPAVEPESKKTLIKMSLSGISMVFLTSIFFYFFGNI